MEKRLVSTLRNATCALFFAVATTLSFAQDATPAKKIKDHRTNPEVFFLQEGDVPNSYLLLPPPLTVLQSHSLTIKPAIHGARPCVTPPRGDQAVTDARVEGNGCPEAFSEAFGVEIDENTPEILKLVVGMREDAGDLGTREAKELLQPPATVLILFGRYL